MTRDEMDKSGSTNFVEMLNKIEPKALELVDDNTKTEILQSIKKFLSEIVEV